MSPQEFNVVDVVVTLVVLIKAGKRTGPVLSEPVLVTGFRYRNRVLPEPVLPEISNGFVRSLSYRIGPDRNRFLPDHLCTVSIEFKCKL
ncbi:hypothetical protein H5410_001439 [Solanum commersonii]|uniref:Uncharacterized protein n=1 Tax=Solanum commersonii TaxID=4109 RepID=A0A9J6AZK5_SOLCO|nr:hypothetical protein H5410_001439 [Solanum commersonii]